MRKLIMSALVFAVAISAVTISLQAPPAEAGRIGACCQGIDLKKGYCDAQCPHD